MGQASVSKSEIDRLGDRLRETVSPDDLRMLDDYRLSFADAYDEVVNTIRGRTGIDVSGRPAKSTTAIVEKLKRESIRLSQMQDIAGCRIVTDDRNTQDALTAMLAGQFTMSHVFDRREKHSHGYRAVHVIVPVQARVVEIQIRTRLQHLWAELSEKLADKHGIGVKYGAGPLEWRELLERISTRIRILEIGNSIAKRPDVFDREEKNRLFESRTAEVKSLLVDLLKVAERKA